MFDINEIRKRAQQAGAQASASVKKTIEKSEELIDEIEVPGSEKDASMSAAEAEEQIAADTERQAEILGQIFGADSMAQMGVLVPGLHREKSGLHSVCQHRQKNRRDFRYAGFLRNFICFLMRLRMETCGAFRYAQWIIYR